MAADYWASTQRRHWQFTRESLAQIRESLEDEETDLIQQYPLPDRRLLSQFFAHQLAKLGKRLSVRQQALATAQVYMKRFYTKIEIRHTNPYLVVATALYLACKMEECPQHIRVVVSEARQTWPAESTFSDPANLGECEFALISTLNSHLIIHHPYRSLSSLSQSHSHSNTPGHHQLFSIAQDESSLAWSIINDHYLTDLPLLHPPHVIAVMAILLAMTLKPTPGGLTSATAFPGSVGTGATAAGAQLLMGSLPAAAAAAAAARSGGKEGGAGAGMSGAAQEEVVLSPQQRKVQGLVKWLAEGEVDIAAVVECSQEMISLYDVLDQYSEKACKEQIARFVKGRGLDK